MQNIILTVSPCGCPRVFIGEADVLPIPLVDSEKRPIGPFFIGWVQLGDDQRPVNLIFADDTALLTYLNTTFVAAWNYEGVFTIEDSFVVYSNNENFETAEIMVQFGLKNLVCVIGDPIPAPNIPVAASFDNGDTFADEIFANLEIVQVKISGIPLQPVDGVAGFEYTADDGSDPVQGVIVVGSPLQDCIMEVIFTQIPQA